MPPASPPSLPSSMSGVLLIGHGGIEKLHFRTDLPVPLPRKDEVLVRVSAAAINNTDINTRSGWYDDEVVSATSEGAATGFNIKKGAKAGAKAKDRAKVESSGENRSWSGVSLSFPFIQGADGCGDIVAVGESVEEARVGERVLLCAMQDVSTEGNPYRCACLGSEMDGCYAQYVRVKASEAYRIDSRLSNAELAAIPCAYSTAEGLVSRAGVSKGERVLITGASGGVGLAAVQLARLRGADVVALVGAGKGSAVCDAGASRAIERDLPLRESLEDESIEVVIDLVGGDITHGGRWADLLRVLRHGGRYAVSGAIAGPIVSLDLRKLYLKDLSFFGCTHQGRDVFPRLVEYIERGEVKPVVARQFALSDIHEAQRAFLKKNFVGKIVLLP